MTLKIRLRRQGRKNRPFFRLIVTETETRRDGKYVENVGWYDPMAVAEESQLHVKGDRVQHWLDQGAQLSDKAESLVARAAPEVVKAQKERIIAKREKERVKRKARTAAKSA